jgi:hypothetical protein
MATTAVKAEVGKRRGECIGIKFLLDVADR